MKKIILIIFLLIIPLNVSAVEATFTVNCDKTTVNPGSTLTCTLKGNVTKETISGISATVSTNNEALKLATSTVNKNIWEGDADEGKIAVYTSDDIKDAFDIATFTFNVASSTTTGANVNIIVSDIILTDSNSNDVKGISNVTKSIRIASTVNTLSNLTLSSGTLSPTFTANTLSYTATVNENSVTINATSTDANSKISGNNGIVSLKYGINVFKINVTSESNSVKTYTISITRPDNRDKDNTISTLKLNSDDITLLSDQDKISYQVENEINELKIESTLNSSKASFVNGYGPRIISLKEGDNTFEIKVKAENETVKTYTINVNRKSKVVNDNNDDDDDDIKDNNIQNSTQNNNQKVENPKTDNGYIFIILGIVIISMILILVSYKIYKKKEVKSDEKE